MAYIEKKITNKEDIDYIINIKEPEITKTFLIETFAEFEGKRRFNSTDYIDIPSGVYGKGDKKNKNTFTTTVGIFIFNRYFIENDFFDLFGYINKEIDGGVIEKINQDISYALIEDKITLESLKTYSMKLNQFMLYVTTFSSHYSEKLFTVTDHISTRKKQLEKQYAKELANGDVVIASKIENELLDLAKEYLKGDEVMELYDSKARAKWNVNFKNIHIMKGAINNPDPTKGYDIAMSNYADGISKEEYAVFANSIPEGVYARAKNTQVGGYWVKLFVFAFQDVVLDPEGSDCGTKKYKNIKLTNSNKSLYMYSFILEGSKLIELTSDNIDKYIDKDIKVRMSDLCESKTGICNKCMGNLYYRLGIRNVGMTTSKMPSRVMNWSLKSFHDSSIKIHDMPVSDIFS